MDANRSVTKGHAIVVYININSLHYSYYNQGLINMRKVLDVIKVNYIRIYFIVRIRNSEMSFMHNALQD